MPSKWVEHVKEYAKANYMTYGCALTDKECKRLYKINSKEKIGNYNIDKIKELKGHLLPDYGDYTLYISNPKNTNYRLINDKNRTKEELEKIEVLRAKEREREKKFFEKKEKYYEKKPKSLKSKALYSQFIPNDYIFF